MGILLAYPVFSTCESVDFIMSGLLVAGGLGNTKKTRNVQNNRMSSFVT